MTKFVPSTCWECSTCCGALLTVDEGRVTGVAPYPGHPASRGAFCIKGIRGMRIPCRIEPWTPSP